MPPSAATFPDIIEPIKGRRTKIVVPISLWKATLINDHLRSLVAGLNNLNEKLIHEGHEGIEVEFVLTGLLQRHTHKLSGKTDGEAVAAAKHEETRWLKGGINNQAQLCPSQEEILKQIKCPTKITTWEDHYSKPDHCEYRKVIDSFYTGQNIDTDFKLSIDCAVREFYGAYKNSLSPTEKGKLSDEESKSFCREYILEELAVMLMWQATNRADYMLYPMANKNNINKLIFASLTQLTTKLITTPSENLPGILKDKKLVALQLKNIVFPKEPKNTASPGKGSDSDPDKSPERTLRMDLAMSNLNVKVKNFKEQLEELSDFQTQTLEKGYLYLRELPSLESTLRSKLVDVSTPSFSEKRTSPPRDQLQMGSVVNFFTTPKYQVDASNLNKEQLTKSLKRRIDSFTRLIEIILTKAQELTFDKVNSYAESFDEAIRKLDDLLVCNPTKASNYDSSPHSSPSPPSSSPLKEEVGALGYTLGKSHSNPPSFGGPSHSVGGSYPPIVGSDRTRAPTPTRQ